MMIDADYQIPSARTCSYVRVGHQLYILHVHRQRPAQSNPIIILVRTRSSTLRMFWPGFGYLPSTLRVHTQKVKSSYMRFYL